jgi:hypothetical protein
MSATTETVFSMESVHSAYKRSECSDRVREAGSNTSTVTLRVVGGDENGSLKSEKVKYDCQYQESQDPRKTALARPAAYTKARPVLSSERAPHKSKTVTVKQ